ncbi:hypothetical protein PRIC1_005752 [Phytophthora ramorum]
MLLSSRAYGTDGDKLPGRVKRLDTLLRRVNPLYREVKCNRDFVGVADPLSVYCPRLSDDCGSVSQLVNQDHHRQQTVTTAQEEVAPADETSLVSSETVLIETSSNEEQEARLARALDAIGSRPAYVARRSASVLRKDDPFYMDRVFPHLLTFGIGGFSSQRSHKYSKRDIVLHYLNLSTNCFTEDPLFKLKMFDSFSTQCVQNGVFMSVKRSSEMAIREMYVTPEELDAAIDVRVSKRKVAKVGRPITRQTEVGNDSTLLLKSISASTAKMRCSNQEREVFQRKVSAMAIMYDEPSVFWTLTPNPDSSIAVAFWAGCDLPIGRPKHLDACTMMHMPSTAEMKRLSAQNTAAPGLFGFVEALFYALEQQGRLRVHHHGMLWVAGLPRTKADWDALLSDAAMRTQFEEYCASLFFAELPVFSSLQSIGCPISSCNGELSPIGFDKKYKHRLRNQAPPPTVANCNICSKEYTESALVNAVLKRAWATLNSNQQAASTENAVRELSMRFGGLVSDPATARVQLTRLLRRGQVHAYQHTHSCVKGRFGTKCRYKFFRNLEDSTG